MKITTEQELLDCLRVDPNRRFVFSNLDSESGELAAIVIEQQGGTIAQIDEDGSARTLLEKALEADENMNLEIWQSLPLRYGSFCGVWVLPESSAAPQQPPE